MASLHKARDNSIKMILGEPELFVELDDFEKEVNKEASKEAGKDVKISLSKDFKYPPILPIIFYDGESEWTADTNFLYRTQLNEVFEKYIPKFEYELVCLRNYSFADLAEFGNILSLFMMIDKVRTAEELNHHHLEGGGFASAAEAA